MRLFKALLVVAALAMALLPLSSLGAIQEAITKDGKPVLVEIDFGSALFMSGEDDEWVDAVHGQLAWAGDNLRTNPSSRITLLFFEGSI